MQIIMQVIAKSKDQESLRQAIINDQHLENFDLFVAEKQNPRRGNGWSKLHSRKNTNVINIEWDGAAKILTCRFISKKGTPDQIAGDFLSYLMKFYRSKISSVLVTP